jgi:hypothetical protein
MASENYTKASEIIKSFLINVENTFPSSTTSYNVSKIIKEVRTGTITRELISVVNNATKLKEALAAVSYGDLYRYATVNYSYERRILSHDRRDLVISIPLEITFQVPESLYAVLDGLGFDDEAFEVALALELGIDLDSSDVLIGSDNNMITVEATLSAEPNGYDPLSSSLIDAAKELQDIMELLLSELLNTTSGVYIKSTTVNLCPLQRTCYYHGTCEPINGICSCVGNWWGINCETPCSCGIHGQCVNAYCVCTYPWFGLRCHEESLCSGDSCSPA